VGDREKVAAREKPAGNMGPSEVDKQANQTNQNKPKEKKFGTKGQGKEWEKAERFPVLQFARKQQKYARTKRNGGK